jgi:glycosyltransferase involved in cell wall biosynthesis
MVGHSDNETSAITSVPRDWRTKWLHRLLPLTGLNYLEYLGSYKIPKSDFYQQADIINFHNLHRDYFSYLSLPSITSQKPAVWTLHDMWSFTGHCAYSFDCHRWQFGCGKCPYLGIYPAIRRDGTKWEWRLKDRAYSRSNITIVVPSKWLEDQANKSMFAEYFSIRRIPHGIDTDIFQPMDKDLCRSILDIPKDKVVLLFAAMNLMDYRKGGDLMLEIVQGLPKSLQSRLVMLVMGEKGETLSEQLDINIYPVGYVEEDKLKALLYNAADLFLFPTRADIWSLVVQEAMACGIPSISFNVGGVPDLVRHKVTGFLAEREDVNSFRDAIIQSIEDKSKYQEMSAACRMTAVNEYKLDLQVARYLSLYNTKLNLT